MAWKLVDSFEGGVFLRRARGHQNNFIVGHVKGAFRRRGCDLARATSILHLVGRPAGRYSASTVIALSANASVLKEIASSAK